ncbi:MAG TPA: alpha/beta fold hydrolase [Fimbriiglobus sp.]
MTLAFEESGSGTPLVLLHAFPYDRGMWAPQREGLASVARVITPDLPGFGQSAPMPDITVEGMADAVAQLLDSLRLNERINLGGLSMGGYVAMAFARKYPDRLCGLILADTRGEPDDDTGRLNRGKAIEAVRTGGVAQFVDTQLPNHFSPETFAARPAIVAEAKRIASAQSVEAIIAALVALRDRPDAIAGLSGVSAPTLILVGENDAVTPPAVAETMRTRIPGSRFVRIPAAGHLSNMEQPDVFNASVREFIGRA